MLLPNQNDAFRSQRVFKMTEINEVHIRLYTLESWQHNNTYRHGYKLSE